MTAEGAGLPRIVAVVGPTAVGKTECAVDLAERLNGEVVNADSMQVYRGLDIGTAKPTQQERAGVRFHLIDVVDPDQGFSAGTYCRLARAALEDIASRGKSIILCGGTGMYVRALLHGLFEAPAADRELRRRMAREEKDRPGALYERLKDVDPQKAEAISPGDMVRIVRALEVYELTGTPLSEHHQRRGWARKQYASFIAGLERDREDLYRRIDDRVDRMMEQGFLEEVTRLREKGHRLHLNSMQALGYKHLLEVVEGRCTLEEAVRLLKRDTRRYAKRQWTWFRHEPGCRWYRYPEEYDRLAADAQSFMAGPEPAKPHRKESR